MTASLEIERKDFIIKNVEFPDYLVEMTSNNEYYVEVKRNLSNIFSTFFHSEDFKERDNTDGFLLLHYSLNEMLDGMFLAHHNGINNHMKEQIDKMQHLQQRRA